MHTYMYIFIQIHRYTNDRIYRPEQPNTHITKGINRITKRTYIDEKYTSIHTYIHVQTHKDIIQFIHAPDAREKYSRHQRAISRVKKGSFSL